MKEITMFIRFLLLLRSSSSWSLWWCKNCIGNRICARSCNRNCTSFCTRSQKKKSQIDLISWSWLDPNYFVFQFANNKRQEKISKIVGNDDYLIGNLRDTWPRLSRRCFNCHFNTAINSCSYRHLYRIKTSALSMTTTTTTTASWEYLRRTSQWPTTRLLTAAATTTAATDNRSVWDDQQQQQQQLSLHLSQRQIARYHRLVRLGLSEYLYYRVR